MAKLHLESLPHGTTSGGVFKLLIEEAGVANRDIGRIQLQRRTVAVELPGDICGRAQRKLAETTPELVAWVEPDEIETPAIFRQFEQCLHWEAQEQQERIANDPSALRLKGLRLQDQWSALGGRVVCKLTGKNPQASLPMHGLRVGTPIVLLSSGGEDRARGVVTRLTSASIEVAIGDVWEGEEDKLAVAISTDDVARGRQERALLKAASASGNRTAELRDVLLEQQAPAFDPPDPSLKSARLNDSQQAAVQLALSARDFAIIHGPPGTGKTITLAEIVQAAVARGEKVLACAPSNLAVDNLVERFWACGVKAVRLGHPARVSESLHDALLESLVREHPDAKLADKLVSEAKTLFRKADRFTRAKPAPGEKKSLREEARALLEDAARIQQQTLERLLDDAPVVCCTLTGVDDDLLGARQFDLTVIDEACQTTEPACWIPVSRSQRLVIAGDHCQLPPTVVSQKAEATGFGVSLLERLIARYPKAALRLERQYRMHNHIMEFSSLEFYDGALEADATVAGHTLSDLITADEIWAKPVQFIDTAGADYHEAKDDSSSRTNPREAELAVRKVNQLLALDLRPEQIAVVTPYAAQVRLLRESLPAGVECDSVDGFQGREQEVVICSLVRSNENGEIGFLADVRRMNVAMTRAKRKLIVIGDSSTIGGNEFYGRLLEYVEAIDAYHSVWEEME
ncbi:AAA domain-containing protein [Blastopirellula retiformator]|uniref:ATP-dependent RecD-like DNA helicase n=1 Tax=Blastopirellula retiformator TaxID=2527970 RepID=A0A5C5V6H7_9BACT|nr:AAA domain-containing protein [Blastopirellula retiformator]TWT34194.1 ATP-dependent RecD-like DNA helicase [Blastopirellula retiformator]